MSKKLPGLTLEEHQALGPEVKKLNHGHHELYFKIAHAYPSTKKVTRLAWRALRAFESLKCELDGVICEEHPELPNSVVLNVYYGPLPADNDEKEDKI